MKKQLVSFPIAADSVNTVSVGVPDITPKETTAGGNDRLQNQFGKYRVIEKRHADKILEINSFVKLQFVDLLHMSGFEPNTPCTSTPCGIWTKQQWQAI